MNKLSRRDFLRLSSVAAAGLTLAACQPVATAPGTQNESAGGEGAPAAEQTELRMLWRIMGENEQASMNELFDRFEEQHPDISIETRVFAPYPEVGRKAETWIASGEPPALWSPIAAGSVRFWASRDKVMDLGPYIERDGYDTEEFYEPTLTLCQWRGSWLGLPALNGPTFLVYNKDLFDEAGVDYPPMDWQDETWDWNKWLEVAEALTKFDGDGQPTQYAMDSIGDTRYAMRHWGIEWWNEDVLEVGYPCEFAPERQAVTDTLQFWHDLMYDYQFVPKPGEAEAMAAATPNLFLTGRIAMQISTPSILVSGTDISEFEWGIAPIPHPVDRPRWNYMYPDQWFIITPQEDPDASWELLKFVSSEEGMQYYPTQALGFIPPRPGLRDYYTEYITNQESNHEFTQDELDFVLEANEFQQTAWGHATVDNRQLQREGLQPFWELLLADEITAEECMRRMEEATTPILEEIIPDWACQ